MQKWKHTALIGCAILATLSPAQAPAEETQVELERLNVEVQSLKAGQTAIRKDLQDIKKLLAGLKSPASARPTAGGDIDITLDLTGAPSRGDEAARIILVEYTDYQCPYCERHSRSVMPLIEKNFVATGKIRYVLRDFPLAFHTLAAKAHEAANCAGEQGRYWEMREALFANQNALQPEKLPGYASTAGVADMASFETCLATGRYAERGKQGIAEGQKAGVRGTPSFVLGITNPDGTVKGTKFIRGAQGYAVFEAAINELLAKVDS